MTMPSESEQQPSADGRGLADRGERDQDQDRDLVELTELEHELTELDRALEALETTPETTPES